MRLQGVRDYLGSTFRHGTWPDVNVSILGCMAGAAAVVLAFASFVHDYQDLPYFSSEGR